MISGVYTNSEYNCNEDQDGLYCSYDLYMEPRSLNDIQSFEFVTDRDNCLVDAAFFVESDQQTLFTSS
jgi:hypothetical protein